MKRYINKSGLKARIINACNNVSESRKTGEAYKDLDVNLTNGSSYRIKEGYHLNWSDEDTLKIIESKFTPEANRIINDEDSTFWGKIAGAIFQGIDLHHANTAEIGWEEITEITDVEDDDDDDDDE